VCYNGSGREMEQIRAFVAIELEDELKEQLAQVQQALKSESSEDIVRWVNRQGMHLTLKFLGNVPSGRLKEIVSAIASGSQGVEPFTIGFRGLGCFPSISRPNVVWVGVRGDTDTLIGLQSAVEDRLGVLGYAPEKRKYTPHLTLGRVARHAGPTERRRLGDLIETHAVASLGHMQAREVSLMKSELSPAGARYTCLATVQLEGQA
jgi:2'-5' RNA ligase